MPTDTTNDQVQKYFDALIASYDALTDAVTRANERGLKITRQLSNDIAQGQREALELGKKLAADPADFTQYYTAVLESTTSAQSRALAFAQAAYQEAVGASGDTRETLEKVVNANREAAEAAMAVVRTWTTNNPFAEVFRQGTEAFQAQTQQNTSRATAARK